MSQTSEVFEKRDVHIRMTAAVGWFFAFFLVLMGGFLWLVFGDALNSWLSESSNYDTSIFPEPRLKTTLNPSSIDSADANDKSEESER